MPDIYDLSIIDEINKRKGCTRIAPLSKAHALKLKRFFSGSCFVDDMLGGGFAYKRIQMLFGAKSAGKNAQLNQMIAYNQRMCRRCLIDRNLTTIRPDYWELADSDRWTFYLRYVLGYPRCTCEDKFVSKKFFIIDFEKSLATEESGIALVKHITVKNTGEEIDELDYNDKAMRLDTLKNKEKLTKKESEEIASIEQWILSLDIQEVKVEKMSTEDYIRNCGIIIEELLASEPADTEEGIEFARDFIKSRQVDGVIWDSLQAAVPKYVLGREADQATMGVEAKQNGLLMRLVCSAFSAEDITDEKQAYIPPLFITSQVRASLGGFISGPDTYSGGNAVQHHISIALELKRQKYLKQDGSEATFKDDYYGQRVRIRPDKNKLNAPGGMYEYNYYFKKGESFPVGYIDHVYEIIELAAKYGAIEKSGNFYKFRGKNINGIQNFANELRNDHAVLGSIYRAIMEKKNS